MSPDSKRPVSARFRVILSTDWPDKVVESVKASTGAQITRVKGNVLEGKVELEIRPDDTAAKAVRAWVEAGLGVLMEAPKAPTIEVFDAKD